VSPETLTVGFAGVTHAERAPVVLRRHHRQEDACQRGPVAGGVYVVRLTKRSSAIDKEVGHQHLYGLPVAMPVDLLVPGCFGRLELEVQPLWADPCGP
jgi:hypothetical protein